MIKVGEHIESKNESSCTPLHVAAMAGKAANLAALLKVGADPVALNDNLETPLHRAMLETPLHRAIGARRDLDCISTLLESDEDPNAKDNCGSTPLHWAARSNRPLLITMLLTAGANIAERDAKGLTPLHLAAKAGAPKVIIQLLEAGADGSLTDNEGKTPFDYAKNNIRVDGTDAFWRLNDARFM